MRSLRVFYSNDSCTSGQLVIASRESQYKILHFHNHGLDRLAEIFSEWKFLAQPKDKVWKSSYWEHVVSMKIRRLFSQFLIQLSICSRVCLNFMYNVYFRRKW